MGATHILVDVIPLGVRLLDPIGFQTNRAFKLCMSGNAGTNYEIQVSEDLARTNWTVLGPCKTPTVSGDSGTPPPQIPRTALTARGSCHELASVGSGRPTPDGYLPV